MKRNIITLAFVTILGIISYAQENASTKVEGSEVKVTIQFDKEIHDYGEIELGSDGTTKFEFTNVGQDPLLLTNVRSSCGCTVPQWPKDPIMPGDKGEISVKYNTRAAGGFNKTITVYSNGQPSPIILRIKGRVKPQGANEIKQ